MIIAEAAPAPSKPAKSLEPKTAGQGIAVVPPEAAQRADIQMASAGAAEEPLAEQKGKTPEAIVMAMAPSAVPLPAFAPRAVATASIPAPQTAPFAMARASTAQAEPSVTKPVVANAEMPLGKTEAAAASAPDVVALNVPLPTWRPQNEASLARQPEAVKSADAVAALLAMHHPDVVLDGSAAQRVAVPAPKSEDRVRTSPKADRVQPRLDPEATAVIVPVAERGISGGTGAAAAPVIAANFIRTAPQQVYLDGFQPRGQTSDHRRFTGSAVKFLPIASFK